VLQLKAILLMGAGDVTQPPWKRLDSETLALGQKQMLNGKLSTVAVEDLGKCRCLLQKCRVLARRDLQRNIVDQSGGRVLSETR
jgi:hypothetical protein